MSNEMSTHGILAVLDASRTSDNVKRTVGVSRFENEKFQISISSFWQGEENNPAITSFGISGEGISLLAAALNTFLLNMNDYKNKSEGE